MAFELLIPDELLKDLGRSVVECEHETPIVKIRRKEFTIGMHGSLIYVINNASGTYQRTNFWDLPSGQAFYIYICLLKWLRESDQICPCYLGSTMSPRESVQRWGEGEA